MTWELARELAQTEQVLDQAHRAARSEARAMVEGLGRVLERFGYLSAERPTYKASLLRSIFDTNALTLAELVSRRMLEHLDPAEIAEVCSWFAFDREAPLRSLPLTNRLRRLHEEVLGLQTRILDEERRARVDVSRPINADLKGVALAWAEGEDLGDIAQRSRIAEGDLVGLLQKTLDILGQLRGAVDQLEVPARRAERIDRPDLLERLARRGQRWSGAAWSRSRTAGPSSGPPARARGAARTTGCCRPTPRPSPTPATVGRRRGTGGHAAARAWSRADARPRGRLTRCRVVR